MIKLNSALLLYFIAIILFVIASIFGNENLELFSKPMIIPSLFYYYYIRVRGRINFLFSFSILLYFIGEIILLINKDAFFFEGFAFFLIPYFIISYFLFQDFRYYIKKKKIQINNFSFYVIIILFIYISINMISLLKDDGSVKMIIYSLFGILLFFMGLLVGIIQINCANRTVLFSSLMVTSFIISDIFYIFFTRIPDFLFLKVIYHLLQELTFYFYFSYFISRTNFKIYGKSFI
ncbi:hypothetical protein [Flavobacterium lacisediminis]|uniref:YhhN-like protein n=1 Tax=Flavobacterium lacisediminis TaxID=2989705 RepID=A0ABT3EI57_9FLAO|nr:hypothetical protein [Flavobacterium lacisediminis]MCW1148275.1 hypothetical protein [Flavobacterium lacisediminis]